MDKFEYQILTGRDRMDDWRRGHVVRDVQHGRWFTYFRPLQLGRASSRRAD